MDVVFLNILASEGTIGMVTLVCVPLRHILRLISEALSSEYCLLSAASPPPPFKNHLQPWLVWLSGLSADLQTKGPLV